MKIPKKINKCLLCKSKLTKVSTNIEIETETRCNNCYRFRYCATNIYITIEPHVKWDYGWDYYIGRPLHEIRGKDFSVVANISDVKDFTKFLEYINKINVFK